MIPPHVQGKVDDLLENGRSVSFNAMKGIQSARVCFDDHYLVWLTTLSKCIMAPFPMHAGVSFNSTSDSDISRIVHPPSLFQSHPSLLDQPGLIFTSYSTAVMFPLTQYEKTNSTRLSMIGSSVLGATVVSGQPTAIRNLTEPIVMEFKVNRSMVGRSESCFHSSFEITCSAGY